MNEKPKTECEIYDVSFNLQPIKTYPSILKDRIGYACQEISIYFKDSRDKDCYVYYGGSIVKKKLFNVK